MRRTNHKTTFVLVAATGVLILLLAQRRTASQSRENLTNPLPGLTSAQLVAFNDGLEEFEEVDTIEEGLGPVFNGKSCAECHAGGDVFGQACGERLRVRVLSTNGERQHDNPERFLRCCSICAAVAPVHNSLS